ncbi:hypothetical protein FGO68_gene11611 [Halteria grandinella]|uniref:Uncharacterized protein n=1 Tax=Halteria grandinella TaxID=5974 RepID=A0A8J8NV68_HALGN|nr:hypothetical protein FGO68_gene11611 [Halteria grandinella]
MRKLNIFILGHHDDSIDNAALVLAKVHFPIEAAECLNSYDYRGRNKRHNQIVVTTMEDIAIKDLFDIIKQSLVAQQALNNLPLAQQPY